MDSATLYDAIAEVCPVNVVRVDHPTDRTKWSYQAETGATAQQKSAADNVVATIPTDIKGTVSSSDFIGRFTNAEWRTVNAEAWRQTGGNAKNMDTVLFAGAINFNKKGVIALRDGLIADGTLTAQRASEIFS